MWRASNRILFLVYFFLNDIIFPANMNAFQMTHNGTFENVSLSKLIGTSSDTLFHAKIPEMRFLSLRNVLKSSSLNLRTARSENRLPVPRSTCQSNSVRNGTCVSVNDIEFQCWDKDVLDSDSCISYSEMCCVDRKPQTVDDGPCGTTGFSIRHPRRLRPSPDAVTRDICWMASLIVVKTSGEQKSICDAVILNSTAIMTPSECIVGISKVQQLKRILVRMGKDGLRQSQDFNYERCGQEFAVEKFWPVSDNFLTRIANKGFAVMNLLGEVQKDKCTCRVCLPEKDDFSELSSQTRCYISGSLSNAQGKDYSISNMNIAAFQTNILSSSVCQNLLSPQNLPQQQLDIIHEKLICSVSPQISGLCKGQLGGSLTCVLEDEKHILIGLSIQPLDCYSAPRLFRNTVGCFDNWNDSHTPCKPPELIQSPAQTCGRLKNSMLDPFSLSFQTGNGSNLRHRNVGRRMQMLSTFPVSDVSLMGRSGFSSSEVSQPGLHITQKEALICWEVAVYAPNKGHCSGVLIDSKFILTAAHCLTISDGQPLQDVSLLRVFVGFDSIPRERYRGCEEIHGVKAFTIHPLYSKPSGTRFYDINDLALVELDTPVDFLNNPCACKICIDLPDRNKPVAGEICTLSGYGCPSPILASETCPAPRPWPLTWSNLVLLSDNICSGIPDFPVKAMACTVADGGPSGCYGDSGGPLVCYSKGDQHHYLHAIFSFILSTSASGPQRCRAEPLNPNFYTKVTNYLPWLIENVPGLEINI